MMMVALVWLCFATAVVAYQPDAGSSSRTPRRQHDRISPLLPSSSVYGYATIDYSSANTYIADQYPHVLLQQGTENYFDPAIASRVPIYNARQGLVSGNHKPATLETTFSCQ